MATKNLRNSSEYRTEKSGGGPLFSLRFQAVCVIIQREHLLYFGKGGGVVTAKELNEIFIMRRKLENLLESLRSAADAPCVPELSDAPHSRRARDTVGSLLSEIDDLSARADVLRGEIERREKSAAAFIGNIDDAQTRLIFQLRFMRGCTWKQIAQTIGGGNTISGVKMRYARYMESCDAM